MSSTAQRRDESQAAALAALPWPFLVFPLVASVLIVINEHLLHRHIFDASSLAPAVALIALFAAAVRARRTQRVVVETAVQAPPHRPVTHIAGGLDEVETDRVDEWPLALRIAVGASLACAMLLAAVVDLVLRYGY